MGRKRLKCQICGKPITDHGIKFCKDCRKEAYLLSSRSWKQRVKVKLYLTIPEVGYRSLGKAIVYQAVRDYNRPAYREEVIDFFNSKRCYELCGVDGEKFLEILEKRKHG